MVLIIHVWLCIALFIMCKYTQPYIYVCIMAYIIKPLNIIIKLLNTIKGLRTADDGIIAEGARVSHLGWEIKTEQENEMRFLNIAHNIFCSVWEKGVCVTNT